MARRNLPGTMGGRKESSMATETSHAAWQTQRRFAVKLLAGQGSVRDLADGLPDILSAIDLAVEWLDREDPARERDIQLEIVETRDGVPTEVWTYPPSQDRSAGNELVQRLGFNPAAWQSPVQNNQGTPQAAAHAQTHSLPPEHTSPPRDDRTPLPLADVQVASPTSHKPEPASDLALRIRIAQPTAPPAPAGVAGNPNANKAGHRERPSWATARWIAAITQLAWDDRASRCCLIAAAASLWLTVALADPIFLVTLLVSISGLWVIRRRRVPVTDPDDWL
jgi:hypothetical protein